MIDRTEPMSNIKKIGEKIEYTLFKINQLTEQICLLLVDNEPEKQKAQELCTEHMSRGSKALNESHTYTQNQLEKLHFIYERINLNDPFQQMNERYSQTLVPPIHSISSKGSRSSKSKFRPKFDSYHKQNLFNQNPSPVLYNPQKTNFNPISEIKNHTIHDDDDEHSYSLRNRFYKVIYI